MRDGVEEIFMRMLTICSTGCRVGIVILKQSMVVKQKMMQKPECCDIMNGTGH